MKFKKKYNIADKKSRKIIAHGSWTPTAVDYQGIMADYVQISRKRNKNKLAVLKLQSHLIQDVIMHQAMLDQYNDKLSEIKKKLFKSKAQVDYLQNEIYANELVIRYLKDIFDGIAWRLLEYNRAILYCLSDKPESGPVKQGIGLQKELEFWIEQFAYGNKRAILNDLTNVIRVGDVTIFNEDGNVEFVEIKSGKNPRGKKWKSRLERQKAHMEETIKFINTGIGTLDGQPIVVKYIPIEPQNNFDVLQKVLKASNESGFSHIVIEDYMVIECVDFASKVKSKEIINYFDSKVHPIWKKWEEDGDYIYPLASHNDRLDFSRNLAPISIWPLEADLCAEIMMKRYMISTTFNISAFQRKLAKEGWIVDKTKFDITEERKLESLDGNSIKSFMTVQKGEFFVDVPPLFLARCIFEFLKPETLIKTFEWLHQNIPKDFKELVLTGFEEERKIWL